MFMSGKLRSLATNWREMSLQLDLASKSNLVWTLLMSFNVIWTYSKVARTKTERCGTSVKPSLYTVSNSLLARQLLKLVIQGLSPHVEWKELYMRQSRWSIPPPVEVIGSTRSSLPSRPAVESTRATPRWWLTDKMRFLSVYELVRCAQGTISKLAPWTSFTDTVLAGYSTTYV